MGSQVEGGCYARGTHHQKEKEFGGFKEKKSSSCKWLYLPELLRLEAPFQAGVSGKESTYLKDDSWVSFYCFLVSDFPRTPWIPRGRMHLGSPLSQASEMQKAQSWWERLVCGHFCHLLWDIISGSSSSNTGVTWEKRFTGSKHSPSDNLEPHSLTLTSSSSARISTHSIESGRVQTGKGPWGHFVSWESVLIKVTQVVTKPQVDCRSPDWWASAFPYSTNYNND